MMVSRYIRGATLSAGQVFLSWETSIILMGQRAILGSGDTTINITVGGDSLETMIALNYKVNWTITMQDPSSN